MRDELILEECANCGATFEGDCCDSPDMVECTYLEEMRCPLCFKMFEMWDDYVNIVMEDSYGAASPQEYHKIFDKPICLTCSKRFNDGNYTHKELDKLIGA